MSPDQNRDAGTMPGVRDYQILMPFTRPDSAETVTMIVRLPAANATAAAQLGRYIAVTIGNAAAAADSTPWKPNLDDVTATDVDDTPSIDEVNAELDHWRRLFTAFAGKTGGMVTITADEYQAADFSTLALVPVDEQTMLFTTDAAMTDAQQSPITSAPAPADVVLPAAYGGYRDPDVRQVNMATLTMFPPKVVELLDDNQWKPVVGINVTPHLTVEVTVAPDDGEYETVTLDDLGAHAIVRPITVEAQGSDLPAAATHGRQILTATGWWTLATGEYMGAFSDTYKVMLVKDPQEFDPLGRPIGIYEPHVEKITTSYSAGEQVLLRNRPGSWWS